MKALVEFYKIFEREFVFPLAYLPKILLELGLQKSCVVCVFQIQLLHVYAAS